MEADAELAGPDRALADLLESYQLFTRSTADPDSADADEAPADSLHTMLAVLDGLANLVDDQLMVMGVDPEEEEEEEEGPAEDDQGAADDASASHSKKRNRNGTRRRGRANDAPEKTVEDEDARAFLGLISCGPLDSPSLVEALSPFGPKQKTKNRLDAIGQAIELSARGVVWASEGQWKQALAKVATKARQSSKALPSPFGDSVQRIKDPVERLVAREKILGDSRDRQSGSALIDHVLHSIAQIGQNLDWNRLQRNEDRSQVLKDVYTVLHPHVLDGLSKQALAQFWDNCESKGHAYAHWRKGQHNTQTGRNRLQDLVFIGGPLMLLCPAANVRTLAHANASTPWKTTLRVPLATLVAADPQPGPERFDASAQAVLAFVAALTPDEAILTMVGEFFEECEDFWLDPRSCVGERGTGRYTST